MTHIDREGLWLFLLGLLPLWLFAMWLMFRTGRRIQQRRPAARTLDDFEQPGLVQELMSVQRAEEVGGIRVFHGALRESAARAYARLKAGFPGFIVPLIQEDREGGAAIVLMPKPAEMATMETPVRSWVHWLLFGLTVLTTTAAGALQQGVNLLRQPERFAVGLPFSLSLLAILGCHELGHYFTARHHGVKVTPPYFIPVPFALGTFGAFIKMRSPAENRRQLFDIAVAGPLAGLVVAIPILYFGLKSSAVLPGVPAEMANRISFLQPSLLFSLIGKVALGGHLSSGSVVQLSPLAFAGWLGLFVTALNLLPIGQLDGGHIARAMFGTRVGMTISTVAMWALALAAVLLWPSLMMWALIVFFLAGRASPPLNDLTPVTPRRRMLGYAAFVILALIIVPGPRA